jgi:hypothetical protein
LHDKYEPQTQASIVLVAEFAYMTSLPWFFCNEVGTMFVKCGLQNSYIDIGKLGATL